MKDEKESLVQPGEEIGPYQVMRAFRGHGGMAQVCEVKVRDKYYQPGMPKRLAMKIADDLHQHALVAEAEYLSRFDHPNVVRVFPLPGFESRAVYAAKERFAVGWRWYYVMELLDGGSLHHSLTSPTTALAGAFARSTTTGEQPLAVVTALGIGRQLARALEHIHTRGIINLDVKPNNILFRRRKAQFIKSSVPSAVLSDFGIARDLRYPRFGVLGVATPEYMSPEHAREVIAQPNTPLQTSAPVHTTPPGPRSDLFSLGVLLYEILTGEMPFESVGTLLHASYTPKPPREIRPSIPTALEEAVMRALAKDPAARYPSATEMADDLDKIRQQLDWGMVGRRVFAGVAVTAVIAAGIVGTPYVTDYLHLSRQTPPPTVAVGHTPPPPPPATTVAPTPLRATPTRPAPAATKAPSIATSTPKPTSTATPTPWPTSTLAPTPTK